MILSTWLLYVLVPIVYKFIYGNFPENIKSLGYVPERYMIKAAFIVTITFAISCILIWIIPLGKKTSLGGIRIGKSYYYVALLFYIFLSYKSGVLDYYGTITGGASGSLLSYYSMLFYPVVLFLIYLFCADSEKGLIILVASYLFITLLSSSRSGAVHLSIYILGYAIIAGCKSNYNGGQNSKSKAKRKILIMVVALVIVAPVIYVISTSARGSITSNASHSSIETIAARCSCLDEAGLGLYIIENDDKAREIFLKQLPWFLKGYCPSVMK